MHLSLQYTQQEMESIISSLIEKNGQHDGGIRITVTGGNSPDGYSLGSPCVLITSHTFQSPSDELSRKGIKLALYEHSRQLPAVKTTDYLMAIWLQPWLREQKADEVLYHAGKIITETPRANIFIITSGNIIRTPADNILKGITRKNIIDCAGKFYKVEEKPVHLDDLATAKEVFISSTTKTILPVSQIAGQTYATPGAVTSHLQILLKQYEREHAARCTLHDTSRKP